MNHFMKVVMPCKNMFLGIMACAFLHLSSLAQQNKSNTVTRSNNEKVQTPGIKLINPYRSGKPYPYKASLHNHSSFHPEYTHASEPPENRLESYRDYSSDPSYGIVGISDHSRITTPWNTTPFMWDTEKKIPWNVKNILWIPCNETAIGNVREGGVFGDLLVVNIPTEQTDEPDWVFYKNNKTQSGMIAFSREVPSSADLSFTGTALKWIACKEPGGGIVTVYLDNKEIGEVNLHSADTLFKQEVFSIDNLKDGNHRLRVVYARKGESSEKYTGKINVDMFLVTKANGTPVQYMPGHPDLICYPLKYKYTFHPNGQGRAVEKAFQALSEPGCFLVLAHPNARLETQGEYTGKQLWTSAGYTYDELDLIFGNKAKQIASLRYLPHALEIGNRGYDFSDRSGYKNAEEKWDYLLSQGIRVWGTASDDSHGKDLFEGWVVINTNAKDADKLSVEDVMESLHAGNYYSSQGPNMKINVDRNTMHIQTDKPALIEFISKGKVIHKEENVTKAEYHIRGDELYVRARITCSDEKWRNVKGGIGRKRSAWSNPIYIN